MLYSVMLECTATQGSEDTFVRDVKAAPSPQCVLFFDWQLQDMRRFLTNNKEFGVFTADTTYNLGEFYITRTAYPHLMLEDVRSKQHPTVVGPILVHQQTDSASFVPSTAPSVASSSSTTSSKSLSVNAEDCGILTIPFITLQDMWKKVEWLLSSSTEITPAPGSDPKARMVLSLTSDTPHFVRCKATLLIS